MINVRGQLIKRIIAAIFTVFVLMNILAYFHASKFTHFDDLATTKTKDGQYLSPAEKVKTLFLGVSNPRPANKRLPSRPFETVRLQSNKQMECWLIKHAAPKGTVILFHGYSAEKSTMLNKAELFFNLGYTTFLVDFMGSGGSEGNQTTIGFYEAEEVKAAFNYVEKHGEKNCILFGTSMGGVAIMKALNDYKLKPSAIMIECPFGTMLETVQARFKIMHVPSFPMANLLTFWGGYQNGFNAFKHNPVDYAKNITCPTLLLYGGKDNKVSRAEIDKLFMNIPATLKQLKIYPLAAHDDYLNKYEKEWTMDVAHFIQLTGKGRTNESPVNLSN